MEVVKLCKTCGLIIRNSIVGGFVILAFSHPMEELICDYCRHLNAPDINESSSRPNNFNITVSGFSDTASTIGYTRPTGPSV